MARPAIWASNIYGCTSPSKPAAYMRIIGKNQRFFVLYRQSGKIRMWNFWWANRVIGHKCVIFARTKTRTLSQRCQIRYCVKYTLRPVFWVTSLHEQSHHLKTWFLIYKFWHTLHMRSQDFELKWEHIFFSNFDGIILGGHFNNTKRLRI